MELKSAKIIVRDIGFGDSIYVNVVRENGENIAYLIDTGYLNKENAYKNKLKAAGINKIDTLILTHKHSDHISAANFLIEHSMDYSLRNIFLSFKDTFFASDTNIKLSNKLFDIYDKTKILNVFDINDSRAVKKYMDDFQVLYPYKDMEPHGDINRDSIVLLLNVGKYGVLFTGDVTAEEEVFILNKMKTRKICEVYVLKIAHHGSTKSTSEEFLNKMKYLKYAAVSSNINRRHNLPSVEFENRWRKFARDKDCTLYYTECDSSNIKQDIIFNISLERGCEVECKHQ